MKKKNKGWILLLFILLQACNNKIEAPVILSEIDKVVDAFIDVQLHDCSDALGRVSTNNGSTKELLKVKVLLDSMITPIDTIAVNRSLSREYVSFELQRKTKSENGSSVNIGKHLQISSKKVFLTDQDSIDKYRRSSLGRLLQDRKDTIICNAFKVFKPAVNEENTQAVIPFVENSTMKFAILEKDSIWKIKLTILTEIE